jgi:hypothetical protein
VRSREGERGADEPRKEEKGRALLGPQSNGANENNWRDGEKRDKEIKGRIT